MVSRYFAVIGLTIYDLVVPVLLLFFYFQVIELSHSEVVKQLQLGSYVALIVVQANRFMGHKVSNYHLN